MDLRERAGSPYLFPTKNSLTALRNAHRQLRAGIAEWEQQFVVRAPAAASEPVEVRPRSTPNLKVWAELPNRSLTFPRATRGDARGKRYCKVSLADPTGERTKDLVRGDERHELPAWFDILQTRMRLKQTVRPTRGTDGEVLVVLVPPDDHAAMIRLFFAMKVWVLKERVALA